MPFYRIEPSSNSVDLLNHPGFREDPWNLHADTYLEGTLERQKGVPHANCLALALTRMVFPVSLPHPPRISKAEYLSGCPSRTAFSSLLETS